MNEQEYMKFFEDTVKKNKIVLFTKGTKDAPMCGFSKATIDVFRQMNVPFETVDILADPMVRTYLPKYSNWPTFPQVFVNGKLVGGCDITRELFTSGELKTIVDQALKA